MQVNVIKVQGPDGDTGHEEAEVLITDSKGVQLRLRVWSDQYSEPWPTLERISASGETIDLIDAAETAGRMLGRRVDFYGDPR